MPSTAYGTSAATLVSSTDLTTPLGASVSDADLMRGRKMYVPNTQRLRTISMVPIRLDDKVELTAQGHNDNH